MSNSAYVLVLLILVSIGAVLSLFLLRGSRRFPLVWGLPVFFLLGIHRIYQLYQGSFDGLYIAPGDDVKIQTIIRFMAINLVTAGLVIRNEDNINSHASNQRTIAELKSRLSEIESRMAGGQDLEAGNNGKPN